MSRGFFITIIIMIIFFIHCSPVSANITLFTHNADQGELWASGEIVSRYENWNWFEPLPQSNDNNDYDYYFVRSRLALGYRFKWLEAFIQIQDTHVGELPNNSLAAPPAGPLGFGAIYYAHRKKTDSHGTFVKQGYLRLQNIIFDGFSLMGGRFDYIDGMEVTYDNPKIMWLKKMRLAERLIGPFGWSAFTRSFDGGQVSLDKELFNITAMVSHPTEGGFENDHRTINKITVVATTLTLKHDKIIPHTENRLFYYFYGDDRHIPKVDNTIPGSQENQGKIEIHTLGFHVLNTVDVGPGVGDFLLWGTGQFGKWGGLTHKAWAWTAEAGYQFTNIPAKPWLRTGYFMSSGDSDPTDSEHGTFFQILPTARKYALFPFYNLMNSEDFFIQVILKPIRKMVVRTDFRILQLNERDDRWYMGSGATRRRGTIFGYIGRPSFGSKDLAKLLDISVSYIFNKNINLNAYYGHAWGDDVIKNINTEDDDADFFFFELGLRF